MTSIDRNCRDIESVARYLQMRAGHLIDELHVLGRISTATMLPPPVDLMTPMYEQAQAIAASLNDMIDRIRNQRRHVQTFLN
jgi:hypothetical protein